MWISAYRYRDQVYRFLVNARTGEIRGERPYSAMKIVILVAVIFIVITVLIVLSQQH